MMTLSEGLVERTYWSPSNAPAQRLRWEVATCRVPRCHFGQSCVLSYNRLSLAAAVVTADAPNSSSSPVPPSLPPIDRPRIFVWYQKGCVACDSSRPVFDALPLAAPGYTVHEMEATREMLQRFPHIQVVPLYDIVHPEPGSSSPYGADTRLQTVRNDLTALRDVFPTLTVVPKL